MFSLAPPRPVFTAAEICQLIALRERYWRTGGDRFSEAEIRRLEFWRWLYGR